MSTTILWLFSSPSAMHDAPAFKGTRFALYVWSRPEPSHVRTKHRAPQTNGVIERFFESIKYEHVYREEIPTALVLAEEIEAYRGLYNEVRPHKALGFATPMVAYLAPPESNPFGAESVQES